MAAYRPLGQFNQYFLNDGTVNNGGSITFYETDLTTLKATYSDPALTVVNSNPVVLDAAGRLSTDVWGSGNYGAVIEDSLGATIETRNNIQSGADAGQVIPALTIGDYLTNDGSVLLWEPVLQVPDPTGLTNYILSNDGTLPHWVAITSLINNPTVVATTTTLQLADKLIQWGSSSAPASGFRQTSKAVLFSPAFSGTAYYVGIITTTTASCSGLQIGVPAVTSKSSTGFSVQFDSDDFGQDNAVFSGAVTFDWFAIGPA